MTNIQSYIGGRIEDKLRPECVMKVIKEEFKLYGVSRYHDHKSGLSHVSSIRPQ